MRIPVLCAILLAIACLGGCAHPMSIKPDLATLSTVTVPESSRIPKTVGLYIAEADKAKLVTTAGGGGDKVSYTPYSDLETGIYKVLSDVFESVVALASLPGQGSVDNVTLVVQPEILTESSSNGILTWMATDFAVTVNCKFTAPDGSAVTTVSATGSGNANFDELKANFSLAGDRASVAALNKLRTALMESEALKR
jgi:uncharacterized lipoprotein YajG